jgi:hypothetical protein
MAQRIAAVLSLLAFAVCIAIGASAGNPFGTVVLRALLAMLVTMVIGLVLGLMAQRMLDENLRTEEEKSRNVTVNSTEDGR